MSSAEDPGRKPDAAPPEPVPTEPGVIRQELGLAAELAALAGFAVVQPILGPFGESAETFVSAGASPRDIVIFAVLVAVVPAAVLALVASASRVFGRTVRTWVQVVLVGALVAVATTAFARRFDIGAGARVAIAAVAGVGVALLYRRLEPVRLFLRFASPTPLLLGAVFLLASPVSTLVRPAEHAAAAGAGGQHPPVLFVLLDELPTDSILDATGAVDSTLFPNLAGLAATSTWYRNHTAVADKTVMSVPAIATGHLPDPGPESPVVADGYPDNLLTLLAPTHEVHATEWMSSLCPPSLCTGGSPSIDKDAAALLDAPVEQAEPLRSLVDTAGSFWWEQAWPPGSPPERELVLAGASEPSEVVRPALEFLSRLREPAGARPRLDYVHIPLPHQPWRLLPSGGSYDGPNPAPGSEFLAWGGGDHDIQLGQAARSRHLLQLQWVDRWLGAVRQRMEELGTWDDAVVVLTADHGVSFGPGRDLRTAATTNQTDIYWSPLFIKAPRQRDAAVDDANVMAMDVLPTVVDLTGVDVPADVAERFDGVSLTRPVPSDRPKRAYATRPDFFGLPEAPDGAIVDLDPARLSDVLRGGWPGDPADPLRVWRYGRLGSLLGRPIGELGVCGAGPAATYEPPRGWQAYSDGTFDRSSGPLPLWHDAKIETDTPMDIAAALGGRIVAWGVTRRVQSGTVVSLLLAEPLTEGVGGVPRLYQVLDKPGCALAPLQG